MNLVYSRGVAGDWQLVVANARIQGILLFRSEFYFYLDPDRDVYIRNAWLRGLCQIAAGSLYVFVF